MILTAHQPAYLPWLGYFDKIARSDIFVYLETVQFEKNSYINRNKIKTFQGPTWLTVPIKLKGHTSSRIHETLIDNSQNWQEKHLKTIRHSYSKATRFEWCFPKFQTLLLRKYDLLADLCFDHLTFWLKELELKQKIIRSTDLNLTTKKSNLILEICTHFGAERYVSGTMGRDYLNEGLFSAEGIQIVYQDFLHPQYPQLYGEFIPNLGILDYWMNVEEFSVNQFPPHPLSR